MRVRPITPDLLVAEIAERALAAAPDGRLRIAVDGPPPAEPEALATEVVEALRVGGRPAVVVPTAGFLRPASLRFEHGRTDPDAFYTDWLDENGLRREVLDPAGPDGSGRILPSLWDPATDRASRAPYVTLATNAVVLVAGGLLLGGGLPFDLTVHLDVSEAALARRTEPDLAWTLPAWRRYATEVDPATWADVVVRADDVRHPALVTSG